MPNRKSLEIIYLVINIAYLYMPNRKSLEIILVINIAYEWIHLVLVRCVVSSIKLLLIVIEVL